MLNKKYYMLIKISDNEYKISISLNKISDMLYKISNISDILINKQDI